jgi:hypothetical protein
MLGRTGRLMVAVLALAFRRRRWRAGGDGGLVEPVHLGGVPLGRRRMIIPDLTPL